MTAKKQFNGSANELEVAFYDAISKGDLDGLMALWAEDEEIVCIHPGGARLIGHTDIRASWEAIFERGTVHIHPMQLHAMHNMFTAVHSVIEEVQRVSERAQELHIIASNVYVKTPHGWRIATHHASVAAGAPPVDLFKAGILH